MKRLFPALLFACLLSFLPTRAHAQAGIYGMFEADHYSGRGVGTGGLTTGSNTPVGGTFGFYDDVIHAGPIHLGYDARFKIDNSSSSSSPYGNKLLGGLFGGRLDANPIVLPFRPYVQAEVGAIATNNGNAASRSTGFGYQVQFGGDVTLFPHVGARLEYGAGQVRNNGAGNTLQSFGAGLVVRL